MKLHLLIDTCVWLDLAKDYRQLPLLDALVAMKEAGELEIVLPEIVVEIQPQQGASHLGKQTQPFKPFQASARSDDKVRAPRWTRCCDSKIE